MIGSTTENEAFRKTDTKQESGIFLCVLLQRLEGRETSCLSNSHASEMHENFGGRLFCPSEADN